MSARFGFLTVPAMTLVLCLGGCPTTDNPNIAAVSLSPRLAAETVVASASFPVGMAFAPDGRLFYGERQTGQIRILQGGLLLAAPFAAVAVNFAGQRGLLDVKLSPSFESDGRVYVLYSLSDLGVSTNDPNAIIDHRVVYFEADGNTAAGSEIFVASLPVTNSTANIGGRLVFARDGTLLVGLGDMGDPANVQSDDSLVGKILRFNRDGSIPADNPIPDSPVFARGLRDVQGLAIDPATGDPFALDQNTGGFQELNRIGADRNYGWPFVIGLATAANELAFAGATPGYTDPSFDSSSFITQVAGGAFNPAGRYGPRRERQFFCGDPGERRVVVLVLNPDRTSAKAETFAGPFASAVTDVAFSSTGTLYVACETGIFRVIEP